jgi:hypothetical protein
LEEAFLISKADYYLIKVLAEEALEAAKYVDDLACLPRAQQFRGRVRLTCPAEAYQVEVERNGCVVRLRPAWPAFFALNGLN